MWDRLRAEIGKIWSSASTQILGWLVCAQAVLLDANAQAFIASVPWMPKIVAVVGFGVAVLRPFTPPPPRV